MSVPFPAKPTAAVAPRGPRTAPSPPAREASPPPRGPCPRRSRVAGVTSRPAPATPGGKGKGFLARKKTGMGGTGADTPDGEDSCDLRATYADADGRIKPEVVPGTRIR